MSRLSINSIGYLLIIFLCQYSCGYAESFQNNVRLFFKHSDVIAYSRGSLNNYQDYGVTFVAWGGYPKSDPDSIAGYKRHIRGAMKVGTKIGAKIGTITESRSLIGYAGKKCLKSRILTLDGCPVIVPSCRGKKHKGFPIYWFCTNSPDFRSYLKANVKRAMECGAFGIMMDDPLGTYQSVWHHGGCYCKYCITGFRKFLRTHFTKAELISMGISNVETFDIQKYYKEFEQLTPYERPLYYIFLAYQLESSSEMFQEVIDYAIQIRGKRIPISGNINPISKISGRLFNLVDYFSCECDMQAKTGTLENARSLFAFKVADALKRPAAIMGNGGDHAFIQEKNLPGIIRCWIAEAYAFGNYFMAPYRLWAYTPEKGSHNYRPRHKSELAPMYQFIKHHADLFDNYEVTSRVALLDSYESYRKGSKSVGILVNKLADLNVPFDIVIAGDDILNVHLTKSQLKKYDMVIVPSDALLASVDSVMLKQFTASGGVVIDDIKKLDMSTQIRIMGAERIRATLRSVPSDPGRPVVVHLLNRDYDVNYDCCQAKSDFTVRIPKKLLGKREIHNAVYVRPNSWEPKKKGYFLRPQKKMPDLDLVWEDSQNYVEVKIPVLDVWGIIILSLT